MCYSVESSLSAWVVSIAIAGYLWYRNRNYDRWNAMFITSFALIQLWEAGIWSTDNAATQQVFTKLIAITLVLQPIAQTAGAWYYANQTSTILPILLFGYSLLMLYTLWSICNYNYWISRGKNGHLVWNTDGPGLVSTNITGLLYLVGLFFGLFYGLPTTAPLLFIGVLSLVWAVLKTDRNEFASYWCYIAVGYSITCLFV